jgi:hypothetical protein
MGPGIIRGRKRAGLDARQMTIGGPPLVAAFDMESVG